MTVDILTAAGKPAHRICVLGCGGSGKSTLASQLSKINGLPVVHIDQLHWRPGWQESPKEEYLSRHRDAISQDKWIIDGNYGFSLPERLERADMVLLFDFPTWLCIWRVIKRVLKNYGKSRPDMAEGCPERFDAEFMHYIWRYRRDSLPPKKDFLAQYEDKIDVKVFCKPADVQRFIARVKTGQRL